MLRILMRLKMTSTLDLPHQKPFAKCGGWHFPVWVCEMAWEKSNEMIFD